MDQVVWWPLVYLGEGKQRSWVSKLVTTTSHSTHFSLIVCGLICGDAGMRLGVRAEWSSPLLLTAKWGYLENLRSLQVPEWGTLTLGTWLLSVSAEHPKGQINSQGVQRRKGPLLAKGEGRGLLESWEVGTLEKEEWSWGLPGAAMETELQKSEEARLWTLVSPEF